MGSGAVADQWVDVPHPAQADWKEVPHPAASTGSMVGDAVAGIGSGAIHTLTQAYKLIRMIPGVGDKLPEPNAFVEALGQEPDTIAGHVGKYAEQAGEFMIPASKLAKISEGAGLITKAATQAASAAGVEGIHSGGDPAKMADAGALGAAGPLVGAGIGAGVNAIKNNPGIVKAAGSIAPDLVGLVSPRLANGMRAAGKVASAIKGAPTAAASEAAPEAAAADVLATPAPSVQPTPDVAILDGLSQSQAGKPFAELAPWQQNIVRRLAAAGSTEPPQPEVGPAQVANTPARAAPSPKLTSQEIAQQLRDELIKNGATPESLNVPPSEPEVDPEGHAALADLMRNAPAGAGKAIAKANYAGSQEPKAAAATYQAGNRADNATKLAGALFKANLAHADSGSIQPDEWAAIAKSVGIARPPSQTTIAETLFRLKRLEAAAQAFGGKQ